MLSRDADGAYLVVALRKESVDRNFLAPPTMWSTTSRSPQGERG